MMMSCWLRWHRAPRRPPRRSRPRSGGWQPPRSRHWWHWLAALSRRRACSARRPPPRRPAAAAGCQPSPQEPQACWQPARSSTWWHWRVLALSPVRCRRAPQVPPGSAAATLGRRRLRAAARTTFSTQWTSWMLCWRWRETMRAAGSQQLAARSTAPRQRQHGQPPPPQLLPPPRPPLRRRQHRQRRLRRSRSQPLSCCRGGSTYRLPRKCFASGVPAWHAPARAASECIALSRRRQQAAAGGQGCAELWAGSW